MAVAKLGTLWKPASSFTDGGFDAIVKLGASLTAVTFSETFVEADNDMPALPFSLSLMLMASVSPPLKSAVDVKVRPAASASVAFNAA